MSVGVSAAGRPPAGAAPVWAAAAAVPILIAVTAVSPRSAMLLLGVGMVVATLSMAHAWLLSWPVVMSGIVVVILTIPIRRYSLPAALPFQLEPYRLVVGLAGVAWVAAMLVERRTRLRRTGLEAPVALLTLALLLSVALNVRRVTAFGLQTEVVKSLTFFASFLAILFLTASVMWRSRDRDRLLSVVVGGGAVLAFFAIVESRTGFNPFNHLHRVLPILQINWAALPVGTDARGGHVRAYASSQHSIALGAALAMLVPLAGYLYLRTRRARWIVALGLLALGVLATVSRTAMLMLMVELIVLVCLKPAEVRRRWPLVLPLLLATQVAMPGTLGALKRSFLPQGGLIAEQQGGAGTYGSGRIADLGPGLRDWSKAPIAGQGFGTRITNRVDPRVNAPILDNQWLGLLLETGTVGVAAMLWLLFRSVRRLGRRARRDDGEDGWRATAFAAAIAAYGAGMATYDAFSFIQVTFLLFILLGLAAADIALPFRRPAPSR